MAKRNKKGQFQKGGRAKARRSHSSGGGTKIVRAAAPIINVRAPSATTRRRSHKRRSTSSGRRGGVLGSVGNFLGGKGGHRTAIVIGSAALGYASKEGWLAKLPLVGKAGPITSFGLLGWAAEEFLKLKVPPLVDDMITSALALSAFNLGFSGGQTLVGEGAYAMPGGAVFFD
jgi:hypothetical protein